MSDDGSVGMGSMDEEEIQDIVMSDEDEDIDDFSNKDDEFIKEKKTKKLNLKVRDEDRVSPPFLTKYEKARILGARALQISKNAFFSRKKCMF